MIRGQIRVLANISQNWDLTPVSGVIAKIFLIDMSGLQGLWRVASFMGLGLSLLGLAWLHQRMQASNRNAAES